MASKKKKGTPLWQIPLLPFKYVALGLYAPFDYGKKAFYIFNNMEKFEPLMSEEPVKAKQPSKPKPVKGLSNEKVIRPKATVAPKPVKEPKIKEPKPPKPVKEPKAPKVKEPKVPKPPRTPKPPKKPKVQVPKVTPPTSVVPPSAVVGAATTAAKANIDANIAPVKAAAKTLPKAAAKPTNVVPKAAVGAGLAGAAAVAGSKAANKKNKKLEEKKRKAQEQREEYLRLNKDEKDNFMKEAKELRAKQKAEERLRLRAQKEAHKKEKAEKKQAAKYKNLQVMNIEGDSEATIKSKNKKLYRYLVRDEDGKIIKGKFYANAKIEVHSFLMAEGYDIYSIEVDPLGRFNTQIGSVRISTKDLIFFITQLSTYLKAGIPLTDAVRLLSKQASTVQKKALYQVLVYELTMGASFSEALEKQGNSFPRLFINMIKTSELTGGLTEVLDDMEAYYKAADQTRRQMITAMTYPAIIGVFALGIIIFIMVTVVPNFVDIYQSANVELNPWTVFVIDLSEWMANNLILMLSGIVFIIMASIFSYRRITPFRAAVQYLIMKMPVMKDVIIYNEVTMFTKTFSSLLRHDVYITDSMEILSNISNNEIFKFIIHNAIINLQKGEPVSLAFKNQWAFPVVAYEMLLTGEKTGEMGTMMEKVAVYYQDLHQNLVTQLKTFVEPVLIVTLTVIVGGILMSVIVPMFGLYTTLSETM